MDRINKLILSTAFLLLAVAFSIYLVSPRTTGFVGSGIPEENEDSVKIATFAICEEKADYTVCKDKLFASCNKIPLEINGTIFYCNGEEYNASNLPLGEAYNIQNWSDPRQNDFITAWASLE